MQLTFARRRTDLALVVSLLTLTLLLCTPAQTFAAEVRSGDTIIVPAGEIIDDDLYAFGQSVTVLGTVNGDVIAAGRSVTIQGTVTGDVFAGGQSVMMTGPVTGDVMAAGSAVVVSGPVGGAARLAGQSIEVNAPVGHDLLAGGETVNVGPQAPIGRDLLVGGNTLIIGGPVARSIRAGAQSLTLGAFVGGDVLAQVETLHLTSAAQVVGAVSYVSNQDMVVDSGATVGGVTTRRPAEATPVAPSLADQIGARALDWLKTLVGLSALGLVVVLLFPQFSRQATDTLVRTPWNSLGLGFGLLVGVPVASVLLFVIGLLIGGWWIGPLMLALFMGMLPVGYIVSSLLLGQLMMQRAGRPQTPPAWSLLAGLIVFGVVSLVPLAGGVMALAGTIFGIGACVLVLGQQYQGQPLATAVATRSRNHANALLLEQPAAR